jgi:hypothetical protein
MPPSNNSAIRILSSIVPMVLSSATEALPGALFYNVMDGCTALTDMGHLQPATPIQTDKWQPALQKMQSHSEAIGMRFYWIKDGVKNDECLSEGIDDVADYITKPHSPSHHCLMIRDTPLAVCQVYRQEYGNGRRTSACC